MNKSDKALIEEHAKEIAEILRRNIPSEDLNSFKDIELALRSNLLEHVSPRIAEFFYQKKHQQKLDEKE